MTELLELLPGARTRDGRYIASLRGLVRQKLDNLLLGELMGTGIGRSAFISASIDLYRELRETDPALVERFEELAHQYERELPR